MARKKKGADASPEAEAEGEETAKGKKGKDKGKAKSNLVPAIVVAIGLIGGGKLMGGGEAETTAAAGEPAVTTTTVHESGPVVVLDPITLNMSDGRYLKVGLALELKEKKEEGKEKDKGKGGDTDPTKGYARALDIAIAVLGGQTYDGLVSAEGRSQAKAALAERLHEAYGDKVYDVYFTEFVMQ